MGREIGLECTVGQPQTIRVTDTEVIVQTVLTQIHTQSEVIVPQTLRPGKKIALIFISNQFVLRSNGQRERVSILGALEALRTGRGRGFAVTIPGCLP